MKKYTPSVKAIKISEEEFLKLLAIEEFEINTEAQIVGYFMEKLKEPRNIHSPLDIRQSYVTKAVEALQQIKDPINQRRLTSLVQDSSNKIH